VTRVLLRAERINGEKFKYAIRYRLSGETQSRPVQQAN
jgi:hypothetical protein